MQNKNINQQLIGFAKQMRKCPTSPELFIWEILRAKRFAGLVFRRQHIVQPYILDFYCHKLRLAVELDGSQHATVLGREKDQQRTNYLKLQGIDVIRYWNSDVLYQPEQVLMDLWQIVHARQDYDHD